MDELFDSLSEDWISQPRSPHSSPPVLHDLSRSRSELPRYASSRNGKSTLQDLNSSMLNSRITASSEAIGRSSPANRPSQTQKVREYMRDIESDGASMVRTTDKSGQDETAGTVQYNVSPKREAANNVTPEWRRRLLAGGAGKNESTELLSPAPNILENVFRPPTMARKSPPKSIVAKRQIRRQEDAIMSDPRSSFTKDSSPSVFATRADSRKVDQKENRRARVPKDTPSAGRPNLSNNKTPLSEALRTTPLQEIETNAQRLTDAGKVSNVQGANAHSRKPVRQSDHARLQSDQRRSEAILNGNGQYVTLIRGNPYNDSAVEPTPLSPSLNEHISSSAQHKTIHSRPHSRQCVGQPRPCTPDPSPNSPIDSRRAKAPGSPLKLFGNYDTFTNNHMIRRMSKFENALEMKNSENSSSKEESPRRQKAESFRRNLSEDELEHSNSFEGKVEIAATKQSGSVLRAQSPPRARRYSVARQINTSIVPSPAQNASSQEENQDLGPETPSLDSRIVPDLEDSPSQANQSDDDDFSPKKGKRGLYSPARPPRPKRRRTITSSDLNPQKSPVDSQSTKDSSCHARNGIVNMQKDYRGPGGSEAYSTHQSSRSHSEQNLQAADSPTRIVAGALATVATSSLDAVMEQPRKTSVKTADYLNEAQRIMQFIRAEMHPVKAKVESERYAMDDSPRETPSFLESTIDQFSRPPSRAAKTGHKSRSPTPPNPRVTSQLRKFEDQDDLGLAISSSLKSLKISDHEDIKGPDDHENEPETVRDPPDLRIIPHRPQKISTDDTAEHQTMHFESGKADSRGLEEPANMSTKRSIPTTSSNGSSNRIVIAPEMVADLLSDQMAGMVFDRQKGMWIKRKGSIDATTDVHQINNADESEADLFEDIPDLSVNEMEELRRVQHAVSGQQSYQNEVPQETSVSSVSCSLQRQSAESLKSEQDLLNSGERVEYPLGSSAPSRISRVVSTEPLTSTRATSWGDDYLLNKPNAGQEAGRPSVDKERDDEEEDIKSDAAQLSDSSDNLKSGIQPTLGDLPRSKRYQARVVTVAFSSPHNQSSKSFISQEIPRPVSSHPSEKHLQHHEISALHRIDGQRQKLERRVSRRPNQAVPKHNRPLQQIGEFEDFSIVRCSMNRAGRKSLDITISTPAPNRNVLSSHAIGNQSLIPLELSPLSEFSLHQIDRPLEKDVANCTISAWKPFNRALSQAGQDLIRHLTDIEPFEPYWECMRQVDLRSRQLKTAYMLDEFCVGIEDLDISDNELCSLEGIPPTIRQLRISNNAISTLAAWNRLENLQYLDISTNNVSSLKSLCHLIHLRYLVADNNAVSSLEGLEGLDALLGLRLRHNNLKELDFAELSLTRLTHLDLRSNELVRVENLHVVTQIESLYLDDNRLEFFSIASAMPYLQTLGLSNNLLVRCHLENMPRLEAVDLDNNRLSSLPDLRDVGSLRSLSWRNQKCPGQLEYQDTLEIQHLYLTNNKLSCFKPRDTFLNLQTLDLASAGLRALSSNFGKQCPNLRRLNLNQNAIKDIRPLLGIVRLSELHLATNRLARLRRTIAVLEIIGSSLDRLDLRNNPLTVGFYTPSLSQESASENRLVRQNGHLTPISFPPNNYEPAPHWSTYTVVPDLDQSADNGYHARLDGETKLRRRVYETMLLKSCTHLRKLDGHAVQTSTPAASDPVLHRLCELHVVKADQV